jgi:2-desacetyl-2-hydroxyethyl bacteriochlorophyllide A dehydrogenase
MTGPRIVRFAGPRQVDVVAGTELTAYRGSNVYLTKRWDSDRRLFVSEQPSVTYPLSGWGYSEVGRVVEIGGSGASSGSGTGAMSVGDVVHGVWGHRSEAVLPAGDLAGHVLPPALDPIVGVFVRVGAIALNALLAADLHVTESAVVMGQGVIGLLATRLAVLSGATVLAVDRLERRRAVARRFGAAHTLDPTSGGDVAAQVRTLTGAGADVAVELSGTYPALHEAIRSVQPGGRVVAAGFYQGPAMGLDLGEEFHHNRVSIVASQIGGLPTALTHRWDVPRLHRAILDLVAAGRLDVTSLVSHVVPFSDAASAYRLLDEDPSEALQVVLDFRSTEASSE